ncbi:DUF3515 domain-containing protein [Agromyces soli]
MPHRLAPARRRRVVGAFAVVGAALGLTACAQAVPFDPAPFAASADCAALVVRLPDTVAELPERQTNAQGTGAWGEPASVLLRCGVPVPGPTTDRCVSVDGVDWIIDESDAPRYLFTTYGRSPAVEVLVDNDVVSGTSAITDLAKAVSVIPTEGPGCTSIDDLGEVPSTDG